MVSIIVKSKHKYNENCLGDIRILVFNVSITIQFKHHIQMMKKGLKILTFIRQFLFHNRNLAFLAQKRKSNSIFPS